MPLNPDIQLPLKMFKDTTSEKQPEGTYFEALNMVNDGADGNFGSLVNEPGTEYCNNVDGNILGVISIDRNRKILFTSNNSIILFNTDDCSIEYKIKEFTDFNFSNTITGASRVVRGCETIVYWREDNNRDRFFNIDRPEKFITDDKFDVSLFNLDYLSTHPKLSREVRDFGGSIELGTYYFVVEYLDDFENVLFTSPISNEYTAIGEGYNIESFSAEIGGKPLSTESIKLTITNIPDNIGFVKISVVRQTSGDQFTTDQHIVNQELFANSNGTLEYIYTGKNISRGDFDRTLGELTVPRIIYDQSKVITQSQGRLIRANVTENIADYSSYQRFASLIKAKYVVDEVNSDLDILSEEGGRVKSYGIVYVDNAGRISPVFKIIGTNGDLALVQQNCFVLKNTGVNSQNYDVSLRIDGVVTNYSGNIDGSSELEIVCTSSEIEVEAVSPSLLEYEIVVKDKFENEDWKIENTAIKDTTIENGFVSSGTLGYYLSEQKYLNPPNYCDSENTYWGVDCDGNELNGTNVRYHVIPDRSLEPLVNGSFKRRIGIKFDNIVYPNSNIVGHYFVSSDVDVSNISAKGLMVGYQYALTDNDAFSFTEGRYFHNVHVDSLGSQMHSDGTYLTNFISANHLYCSEIPAGEVVVREGLYTDVVNERNRELAPFEPSLPYDILAMFIKEHSLSLDSSSNLVRNIEDSFNLLPRGSFDDIDNYSHSSRFNIFKLNEDFGDQIEYVSIKNKANPFPNLYNIRYRRIGDLNESVIFNGDVFISNFDITNISWLRFGESGGFLTRNNTKLNLEVEYIQNLCVESRINVNRRHQGLDTNVYYDGTEELEVYFTKKISEEFEGLRKLRDSVPEEWYGYNKDYSRLSDYNSYLPLPFTYDYCSKCLGEYPTRILFSERSFAEDRSDNYRVFLANNFRDIESNRGEINAIDYKDQKLIIRTEQSSFFLQPNPQVLQVQDSNVNIGTGDFLSLPPQELNVVNIGYGGQQGLLESVNTDHGLIWVDRKRGKVIKLSGKLEEISREGLYHWFFENLKDQTSECILTYDPEYERLLITNQGNWTISYCFKSKGWKSYHSYLPDRYFFGSQTFFASVGSRLWKHNSKIKFNRYYDVNYKAYVDFVVSDVNTFHPSSVQYNARTEFYNGRWVDNREVTFDELIVYNSNQSTGLQNIVFSKNFNNVLEYNGDTKYVVLTDRNYKISQLRDLATSNDIWSSDQVDRVPININYNKYQFELGRFRDKYVHVRLIFTNVDNRIKINLLATIKLNSIR